MRVETSDRHDAVTSEELTVTYVYTNDDNGNEYLSRVMIRQKRTALLSCHEHPAVVYYNSDHSIDREVWFFNGNEVTEFVYQSGYDAMNVETKRLTAIMNLDWPQPPTKHTYYVNKNP